MIDHLCIDANLVALCSLFSLSRDGVFERAAILEIDGGLDREEAAMQAAWLALHDRWPMVSLPDARRFFYEAPVAMNTMLENDWDRNRLGEWWYERIAGEPPYVIKFPGRRAV